MVLQTGWPRANFDFYAVSWHGGHVCRFNQLHFVLEKVFSDRNCLGWCKIRMDALFKEGRKNKFIS